MLRYLLLLTTLLIIIISSCEREEITTDPSAKISFSLDTLSFDTVFTSLGTATRQFMIYNHNDKPIVISSISLARGSNSYFIFNADGLPGTNQPVTDIRLEANDSTHVFVQAKIDPTSINSPVLVEDSMLFVCNGNQYSVIFTAFGQDVHLIRDSVLKTQTWFNDKPYLILGDIQVDSAETLTIEAGTTIYLHRNSWFVVDGTLLINGTRDMPVVFRGDRLDKANYAPEIPYDKIPGQWGEIFIRNSSKNNIFNYAYIRNAEFGLVAGVLNKDVIKNPEMPDVELNNCRFENFSACALYANRAKIKAVNCIFANSGYMNFSNATGGEYEFYHCTFGNYLALGKEEGIGVALRNYVEIPIKNSDKKETIPGDLDKAYFGNCIIYGDNAEQVVFKSKEDHKFEYMFENCLIRGTVEYLDVTNTKHFSQTRVSKESLDLFKKIDKTNYYYDWNLSKKSAAKDIGKLEIGLLYPTDFNGNTRIFDETPDAGAFEYIAE